MMCANITVREMRKFLAENGCECERNKGRRTDMHGGWEALATAIQAQAWR